MCSFSTGQQLLDWTVWYGTVLYCIYTLTDIEPGALGHAQEDLFVLTSAIALVLND